jgi:hypothetical protein
LANACFNVQRAVSALERLKEKTEENETVSLLSTHPVWVRVSLYYNIILFLSAID